MSSGFVVIVIIAAAVVVVVVVALGRRVFGIPAEIVTWTVPWEGSVNPQPRDSDVAGR